MGAYSNRDMAQPMVGIKLYDGPTTVRNCHFVNFQGQRATGPHGALGARFSNEFQMATTTAVETSTFESTDKTVVLLDRQNDGGNTYNFRDDGSVGGHRGATVLPDKPFYSTASCLKPTATQGVVVCPHKYIQMWVFDMDRGGGSAVLTRNNHQGQSHSDYDLTLIGVTGTAAVRVWQPIVSIGASYLLRFQAQVTKNLALQLANAEINQAVEMAVCYPSGSSIVSVKRGLADTYGVNAPILPDQANHLATSMSSVNSRSLLDGSNYYWDSSRNILFVKITQTNARTDQENFCPLSGCDWIWIQSNAAGSGRECTADAYSGSNSIQISDGDWLSTQFSSKRSSEGEVFFAKRNAEVESADEAEESIATMAQRSVMSLFALCAMLVLL